MTTLSPSMTGETVRPPCVVTAPYSSTIEWLQSGGRPGGPVLRHITQIHAEPPLPDRLARANVEAHHALLRRSDIPDGVLHAQPVARRHRGRPPAERRPP